VPPLLEPLEELLPELDPLLELLPELDPLELELPPPPHEPLLLLLPLLLELPLLPPLPPPHSTGSHSAATTSGLHPGSLVWAWMHSYVVPE
jgi:hypothetical protein